LTTARYYTPGGRSIQLSGISPDIEIDYTPPGEEKEESRPHFMREEDLEGHMENEDYRIEDEGNQAEQDDMDLRLQTILEKDNQVQQALQLLKSWDVIAQIQQVK